MKLKAAVLYRYQKYLKAIGLFCGLLFIPVIGALIATKMNNYEIFTRDSFYMFVLCAILSFIIGITSYKPVFKFFLQNGVSRQSTHLSFILSLPLGIVLAFAESVYHNVFVRVSEMLTDSTGVKTAWYDFFSRSFNYNGSPLKIFVLRVVIGSLAFMMLMSFGYLMSAIFSGMKPFYKLIVSVVLVVLIILSFVLSSVTDSYASMGMPTWLAFIAFFALGGIGSYYVDHYIAAMIILTVLFTSVSHLLIRKAIVRK